MTVFFVMIILGVQVGVVAAITAVVSLLVYFPLQKRLALTIGAKRRDMVRHTDQRVSLTGEALRTIRAIKLYAWEGPVCDKVSAVRREEMKCLWAYLDTNNVLRNLNAIHIPLTALLVFVVYVFLLNGKDQAATDSESAGVGTDNSHTLTVDKVLFILAYINIIRFPLNLLAQAMKFTADGKVCLSTSPSTNPSSTCNFFMLLHICQSLKFFCTRSCIHLCNYLFLCVGVSAAPD